MSWLQGPMLAPSSSWGTPGQGTKKTSYKLDPNAASRYSASIAAAKSGGQAPKAPVKRAPTNNTPYTPYTPAAATQGYAAPAGPSAAEVQAAQEKAEQEAKVKKLRGDIGTKLDGYNRMFGSLYGRINSAADDQADKTRRQYAGQRTALTDDYNTHGPGIDMSYYLSGAGDSSLRLEGIGKAEKALEGSLSKVADSEDTDLAGIGKTRASTMGNYKSQQRAIKDARKAAQESDNPAELRSMLNKVLDNVRGLEADRENFNTEKGFRGSLAKVSKVDDLAPVRETLNSLVKGAANPALKRKLAKDIIAGTGATGKKKKALEDEFLSTIGKE